MPTWALTSMEFRQGSCSQPTIAHHRYHEQCCVFIIFIFHHIALPRSLPYTTLVTLHLLLLCAQVSFRCRAPCTSDTIQLEGMNSYDAATHCASLMAAQRMASGNANALPASPTLSSESRPHLQHQQSSVHASATPTGPHTFHEGCIPSSPLLHQDILQPETAPAHIPPSPDQYSSHAIMTGAQLAAALGGVLENSVPGLSAGLAPPSPYFRTAPMDHFASAF